ncbi:MAG: hypothetical protein OXC62_01050 [Aestuariivita sp.]|nr:hypothetical protein [Aestuariivita sp.]
MWLNSTFGILAVLNTQQKKLTYPSFPLDGLRTLPVPRPDDCDMALMADVYTRYADTPLKPLPEIHTDPVRQALDAAVAEAVPGLPIDALDRYRRGIALEPSVTTRKEPFQLV